MQMATRPDRSISGRQPGTSAGRFFLLTFLFSWAVWLPLMLVRLGVLSRGMDESLIVSLALPGVLMPAVAAIILVTRARGRAGLGTLLRRLLIWRLGVWWLVVLIQPVLLVAAAVLAGLFGDGAFARFVRPESASALLVTVVFLIIAATGEELGWRGFALPALQRRFSPLTASIVLGLATATWHLPYWILQGIVETYGLLYLAVDYVFIVALTLQITWFFNRTAGSVLLPVAFHVVFNAINVALLPVTSDLLGFVVLTALEWVVALALLSRLGPPFTAAPGEGQAQES